jgi:hypothetical protein
MEQWYSLYRLPTSSLSSLIFWTNRIGVKIIYRPRTYNTKFKLLTNDGARSHRKKGISLSSKVHLVNHYFVYPSYTELYGVLLYESLVVDGFASLERVTIKRYYVGLLYETHQPFLFRIRIIWPPRKARALFKLGIGLAERSLSTRLP